jgi:hypothetical protein
MADTVLTHIRSHNLAGFAVRGIVFFDDDSDVGTEVSGIPIVSAFSSLPEYVCRE